MIQLILTSQTEKKHEVLLSENHSEYLLYPEKTKLKLLITLIYLSRAVTFGLSERP